MMLQKSTATTNTNKHYEPQEHLVRRHKICSRNIYVATRRPLSPKAQRACTHTHTHKKASIAHLCGHLHMQRNFRNTMCVFSQLNFLMTYAESHSKNTSRSVKKRNDKHELTEAGLNAM